MDYILGAKRREGEEHQKSLACCRRSSEHISESYDCCDYTVIIKWKDWCAFEVEDVGIDALKRKSNQREMVNSNTECEQDLKAKSGDVEPECTLLHPHMRNMPIPSGESKRSMHDAGDPINIKIYNQQKRRYLQDNADHDSVFIIKSPNSELDISCNLKDLDAQFNGSKKLHSNACASDESAQVEQFYAAKREIACNSSPNAKPSEEAHDAIVMLDGKVKMSDMKTIYEKSHVTVKHKSRSLGYKDAKMMGTLESLPVDFERRTKRRRKNVGTSDAYKGANLVKCPVCSLVIPGDIDDADFNTQINLHVDSCIGFTK